MSLFLHEATVRGRGNFPVDMLRYDSCYPKSESDSFVILRTLNEDLRERVEVVIMKLADHALPSSVWTEARWESFGWEIIRWSKEERGTKDKPHVQKRVRQGGGS
jgi:hypothetical protein